MNNKWKRTESTETDPGRRIYYNNKITFQISKTRTIIPFMVLGKRLTVKDRVRSNLTPYVEIKSNNKYKKMKWKKKIVFFLSDLRRRCLLKLYITEKSHKEGW